MIMYIPTSTETRIITSRLVVYPVFICALWVFLKIMVIALAGNIITTAAVSFPPVLAADASNSVTITWTAPGDNEYIGQAVRYDIRYAIFSITNNNWHQATMVQNPPTPKPANSTETFLITGLNPKTKYYFAIKTYDAEENESLLSNVAVKTTACFESWSCSAWSECFNGEQTRTCVDLNICGTYEDKPDESQTCEEENVCEEDWTCTDWSECSHGQQTRECTDQGLCGTENYKPGETRDCIEGGVGGEPLLMQETYVVVVANQGGGPQVRVFNKYGELLSQFFAYEESFRGGVNVAVGDLGNDGIDEIVVAPGAGRSPEIRIYNYQGDLINRFMAYDKGFGGGVNVAVGELDGRQGAEIVTAPASSGGPNIRTFGYRNGQYIPVIENFFAYSPQLRGGVSIIVANVDGMGKDELLTVPSVNSGGPHVRMFNIIDGRFQEKILGFFAYQQDFRGGVSFGALDWNGDGQYEILTGPETRGGPHVRMFGRREDGSTGLKHPGYFMFHPDFRGGVSVAGGDFNYNGRDEWVVAVRSGDVSLIRIYREDGEKIYHEFLAFPETMMSGIRIAIGHFFAPR